MKPFRSGDLVVLADPEFPYPLHPNHEGAAAGSFTGKMIGFVISYGDDYAQVAVGDALGYVFWAYIKLLE